MRAPSGAIPRHIKIMAEPRRIALFGGTFDPVHLGHVQLATLAQAALALDEVRFLPCRQSPHKTGSQPAAAADRLAMLRLATADLPWAVVEDYEARREGVAFSYETAAALRATQPAARWFWIMGGDQWRALPTWRHPERLAACVEFIVLARDGEPPLPRVGQALHVVSGMHPASATAIREAIRHGQTSHRWLAPAVAEWIATHGVYRQR
jgi:nicotinate-nucleotide adenylyltransferase